MRKSLKVIRLPAFFLGLIVVLSIVLRVFTVADVRGRQVTGAFRAEKEGMVDAVYVGASTTYAYWQAPLGWEKFGFSVYSLAYNSVNCSMLKYLINEGRKTQPDALYIVNVNTFKTTGSTVQQIHYVADFMPLSRNKIDMIQDMSAQAGITGPGVLEFYFPFIRFHSGWDELTSDILTRRMENVKGAMHYNVLLKRSTDVSGKYHETDKLAETTPEQDAALADFLQYCEDENINILFLVVPQSGNSLTTLGQMNAIVQTIRDAGYPVLDMSRSMDEMGLDMHYDFYNVHHVNIHGCSKFMDYLGAYLRENYGFEDKRGDPTYSSWDDAVTEYTKMIAPYTLEFERDGSSRDFSLLRPALTGAEVDVDAVTLAWEQTGDSTPDGWLVYRKTDSTGAWCLMEELDGQAAQYTDGNAEPGRTYYYTVVPVRYEGDEVFYGNYDYAGVSADIPAAGAE